MEGMYNRGENSHHKQYGRSKIKVDDVSNTQTKILIKKKARLNCQLMHKHHV